MEAWRRARRDGQARAAATRRHVLASAAATLAGLLPLLAGGARADDLGRIIEALRSGRNFKVRIQAASALVRFRDRRVIPELARAATGDRNPAVRVYVLRLLAKAGDGKDPLARAAITRALDDRRGDVRAQAQRSLAELDRRQREAAPAPTLGGGLVVAVAGVGDRTGRASAALKAALRAAVAASLRGSRGVRVADPGTAGLTYTIDASIARLALRDSGVEAEVECAVELVVSRPPRGIVLIASGDASVLEPRRSVLRPERRAAMEVEAMEHAVRGAHENLARFFASAR